MGTEPDHDAESETRDAGGWLIGKIGYFCSLVSLIACFKEKTIGT